VAAGTKSVENMFWMAMFFLWEFFGVFDVFDCRHKQVLKRFSIVMVLISSNLFMYVVGLVGFLYVRDEA